MFIHALISSVWTYPEPAVLLVLDRLNEVLAHFVRRRLRVAVLAEYDTSQFLLVPLRHVVLLLSIFLLLLVAVVGIQTPLLRLALHVEVVRKLALLALFAVALLEKLAKNGFWVDAKRYFLYLDGLEELSSFFAGLLGCCLFLLALQFFGFFALLLGGPSRGSCGVDLFDLLLSGPSLLIFHAKGLVDDDLLRLGLVALAFWWHFGWWMTSNECG